jgi:uncharacterized membrane protein YfcA
MVRMGFRQQGSTFSICHNQIICTEHIFYYTCICFQVIVNYSFARQGSEVLDLVLSLVVFTIPGVIVGGQLGSAVASHIPKSTLVHGLDILFIIVAGLTLGAALLL